MYSSADSTDIEVMKKIYHNFLRRPKSHRPFDLDDIIVNEHQKEEYVVVFNELMDLSKKRIQCLTKQETLIIRKWLGVDGTTYRTKKEFCEFIGFTVSAFDKTIDIIHSKLYLRILRGFVDLKEAFKNEQISKEEILSLPLEILYDVSSHVRFLKNARRNYFEGEEIKTVGDLLNLTVYELRTCLGSFNREADALLNYIHYFELTFNGEVYKEHSIDEWHKYVDFDKYDHSEKYAEFDSQNDVRKMIDLRNLFDRLKYVCEQEDLCDKQISKSNAKKASLQKLRTELLNEIYNIMQSENELENKDNLLK